MTATDLRIARGVCRVQYAFDLGQSIALAPLRKLLGEETGPPKRVGDPPATLRLCRAADALSVGRFQTLASVEVELFEFGAASITYFFPIQGALSGLLDLSCGLVDNAALLADARKRMGGLLAEIRAHVTRPGLAETFEDYVVFHVAQIEGAVDIGALLERHGPELAQILRADRGPLSAQEISDALSCRVSFGSSDAVLVDWTSALVLDAEPDEVLWVMQVANVQLMEMRYLESKLDRALGESYEELSRQAGLQGWFGGGHARARWRIAQLQIDGAILFGEVSNALKLVGEQYLSRVYRGLTERFQLVEWNETIARKLETIESIYEKLSDRAATRRMEILEVIIIVLFVVSILISLKPGLGH